MKFAAVVALICATAAPAFAQRYRSRGAFDEGPEAPLQGLYLGISGGGQLMIADGNNAFGYTGELRLGYSFDPKLALYLSGSIDGASFNDGAGGSASLKIESVVLNLQYHLYARPQVMIYARAGIGIGLSSDLAADAAGNSLTSAGLDAQGGIGVEIRVAPALYLAPELFYRNMNLSGGGNSDDVSVIGIQIGLIYY